MKYLCPKYSVRITIMFAVEREAPYLVRQTIGVLYHRQ
jgi:hypothetical protein